MSLFHKKISQLVEILNSSEKDKDKGPLLDGFAEELFKKIDHEFSEVQELNTLLGEYKNHIKRAQDIWRKEGIKKDKIMALLQRAHALVLLLEQKTRDLLGNEHKFLR